MFHLLRKKYHRHLQCLKRFPSLVFDQQLLLLLRNLTLFLYRRDLHFHLDSIRQLVISVNDVSKDSIIYKTINVKWVSLPLITETVSFSVSITKHKDPAKLLLSSSSLMKASFLSSNATLCLSRSLLFFFCFNELFLFLFFVLWLNFDSLSRIRLLLCFLSFNFLSPSSSLLPWLELLHLYKIWK